MSATSAKKKVEKVDLANLPGHRIRRLHQISVALFMEETQDYGITPVQFAALQAVADSPGLDQRTLARTIGFDTSTIGGVIDRLETRGLLARHADPDDRRVRLLELTSEGKKLLRDVTPAMLRAQQRMLEPLSLRQHDEFMRMMEVLLAAHQKSSRDGDSA